MTRQRLDAWCERGILLLVLALVVFPPLALGGVRGQDFAVILLLTAGAGFLWTARLWINPDQPVLWTPVSWGVILFTIYAGLRYLTSDVEYVAREEVLKVLAYAVVFFVVSSNLSRQRHEKTLLLVLGTLVIPLVLYAIYQFVTNSPNVWHYSRGGEYLRRGSGTFFNPNHLAGFLELIAPMGLAFALAGRLKPMQRVFIGYASCMALAGIGVSVSRGGWLATAVGLAVLFMLLAWNRVHRAVALVMLSVLVIGGGGFVLGNPSTQQRLANMFQDGQVQDIRFKLWKPAVEIWQEHVWFGAGPAHFDVRFREHRPQDVQKRPGRVHNDYLNTLADWGVVGTALVAGTWLLLLGGIVRDWRVLAQVQDGMGDARSNRFALTIGGLASLTALLAHSVVDFNFHIPANALLAVTWMALLVGLTRHSPRPKFTWQDTRARGLVTGLLLVAAGILAWQGIRRGVEEHWLAEARKVADLPAEEAPVLERAYDWEPNNPDTAYRLGEDFRLQSWEGDANYKVLAERAIAWHMRAADLQPYDPYSRIGIGMSLDWLGRHEEAEKWFLRAHALDPNHYLTRAKVGWHYAQAEDYARAETWLVKSWEVRNHDNPIAEGYLELVRRRLAEAKPGGKTN